MLDKIQQFVNWMHSKGIPAPTLRDPKHGEPSVSYTMMVLSFSVCLLGLLGKISGFLGGVDMTQAIVLFTVTSGLYWGRQSQISKSGDVTISEEKKE